MGKIYKKWGFSRYGDMSGWTAPDTLKPRVQGGALLINIGNTREIPEAAAGTEQIVVDAYHKQMFPGKIPEISSPDDLDIPTAKVTKVIMSVLNLSHETDGYIRWKCLIGDSEEKGRARFVMKPYYRKIQKVVCHVDSRWNGTLKSISITLGRLGEYGNIWIRDIAITDGPHKLLKHRPDIISENAVPVISVPGILQSDFQMAFDVLNECMVTDVPVSGFPYPFLAPGGGYGQNWWQLDTSLNIAGSKWANQKFAEDVIRGFMKVQAENPDGRIDLWGSEPARGGFGDLSSIPKYFGAARDTAVRSGDIKFIAKVLNSMESYLNWWLSPVKRDQGTGLVTAISEETAGGQGGYPQAFAPVDTNVCIALACLYTAEIAEVLGKSVKKKRYEAEFTAFRNSINKYLWDEAKGYYCTYDLKNKRILDNYICTTFDVFRRGIAPVDRIARLLPQLVNPDLFNWGKVPLMSVARTDRNYKEAKGKYDGTAWYGDIWTLRNMPVISGLEDIGRNDLAAELNWRTIKIFTGKYAEYLEPADGEPHGVQRYGWTASQYIQAVIEHLFGIDYNGVKKILTICPHIPEELRGQTIRISNLTIPSQKEIRIMVDIHTDLSGKYDVKAVAGDGIPDFAIEVI